MIRKGPNDLQLILLIETRLRQRLSSSTPEDETDPGFPSKILAPSCIFGALHLAAEIRREIFQKEKKLIN